MSCLLDVDTKQEIKISLVIFSYYLQCWYCLLSLGLVMLEIRLLVNFDKSVRNV